MISYTLSRTGLWYLMLQSWDLAVWLLVSAENENLMHWSALLPWKSHDPGPFVYTPSHHLRLLWRLTTFLGTKFWSDPRILCSSPAHTVDNIYSENHLKILPKLSTIKCFQRSASQMGASTHIWSSRKNHTAGSSTWH